jgi:hypothetical protein
MMLFADRRSDPELLLKPDWNRLGDGSIFADEVGTTDRISVCLQRLKKRTSCILGI